jgi:hypothetical protein
LQRDPTGFPVQYLGANVPQAWAAGSPFMLLQAMLGIDQDAPREKLYVDPALPDWLPDVTLTDLRLGKRRFDIRFWREGKDTVFKVLKGRRDVVERRVLSAHQNITGAAQSVGEDKKLSPLGDDGGSDVDSRTALPRNY